MQKIFTLLVLLTVVTRSSADIYFIDFETAEGFVTGPLVDQNGWSNFPNVPDQPTVDTSQPSSGSQHARISRDSQVVPGTQSGAFSPAFNIAVSDQSPSVYVDLYFSDLNGAAYDLLAQSVVQNLITWRLRFTNTGDLLVFDSPGGVNGFYDTGFDYPTGEYFTLYVATRTQTNEIDYFINGQLIYSALGGVPFGQTVEQIVVISNNNHADDNEFMAFDRLIVNTANGDFIFADGFEPPPEK